MLEVRNPYNGEIIESLPTDELAAIESKVHQAKMAFSHWKSTPLIRRMEIIGRFRILLQDHQEDLAQLLTQEVGKPITQSRNEISGTLKRIDYFLQHIELAIHTENISQSEKLSEMISWEPLGVLANVSAWNYPYFVGINVIVPAILTGNTLIYKPSEYSPLTGLKIGWLLKQAGLPEGVFHVVVGASQQGRDLLKQELKGVYFTGSYATGKAIAQTTASQLCKLQLELGGKDPVYVRPDVDIKSAAESLADGVFYNTGQSCCSVERIYLHEEIYKEFLGHFLDSVGGFKWGDPSKEETYIGPLARPQHLNYLTKQVDDAVSKGAKLQIGGKVLAEHSGFFEPTVLTQVDHSMEVMIEESFGPIIGIQGVRSDEEAVQLMNDTPYGLTAGVYTKSKEEAKEILDQLESGTVYWNCCDRVSPRLPWTGRKHSGIGSTLSLLGIRSFLQPKAWHMVE